MDGEHPLENWTASTMPSTTRSERRSAGYILQTSERTNEGRVHCYVDLLEASEGADDRAAVLVEHGGRVSREDDGGGKGFIRLGGAPEHRCDSNSMSSIMELEKLQSNEMR